MGNENSGKSADGIRKTGLIFTACKKIFLPRANIIY